MKYKYVTNGKAYYIATYSVGVNFGTSATVRRGGWSKEIALTFGFDQHHAAASAAERLADKREGVL
jgi:hypothetical protein